MEARNAYTGEVSIRVPDRAAGKETVLTFVFDWTAIARIKTELGAVSMADLLTATDPSSLAKLAVIGLAAKHSGITTEDMFAMSPPLRPVATAIEQALSFAYFGPGHAPTPKRSKPVNPLIRMVTKLLPVWSWGSRPE